MPLDRRTSRTRGQTRGLDVEPLECRRLLSATVSRGILAVRGTAADDAIEIRRADQDPGLLEVVENGTVTASRAIESIRQIRIDGGSGDDEILVNQDNGPITIPTQFKGAGATICSAAVPAGTSSTAVSAGTPSNRVGASTAWPMPFGPTGCGSWDRPRHSATT